MSKKDNPAAADSPRAASAPAPDAAASGGATLAARTEETPAAPAPEKPSYTLEKGGTSESGGARKPATSRGRKPASARAGAPASAKSTEAAPAAAPVPAAPAASSEPAPQISPKPRKSSRKTSSAAPAPAADAPAPPPPPPKKILFAASEAHPFASSGGLGDVIGSLPAAIAAAGGDSVDVRVVTPLYGTISPEWRAQMTRVAEFYMPLAWRNLYCGVLSLLRDGVTYYFIDNEYYFKRDTLYGCYDDGERFAYFSRAVLEMLSRIGFVPDILHANDWQTALTVIYLRTQFYYPNMRCVYTIHNIEYQGIYGFEILGDVFGLSPSDRPIVEYRDCINLTKGAIVLADKVTTVSPRYAEEIRDDRFGRGLAAAVKTYNDKFTGIVNGIDEALYNPVRDKTIPATFSRSNMAGKAVCKAELQRSLGLRESPDTPLVVMISRLVAHKGFDLVEQVMEIFLRERDVQLAVLGTGEGRYERYFVWLAGQYPDRAAVRLCYNRNFAAQMYAGGDLFLMPSRSEPCGLSQMMASRYGNVPVVRSVGGLADTVAPFNPMTGEGNGVTFLSYDPYDMLDALRRACGLYDDKKLFARLRRNAMSMDFSWRSSAEKYLALYASL